ncbi:haloacid dehalogenase type II [Nocardiopsis sp. L17-MgMaSL7]|uniref:haloacid dehalogenase type II n=1 Tax=Nocardiopsis sp. L17-MgMaSL7 TaxID=1938893 RepID=UPI000D71C86F|nr:haloacid dehalogenase type II [Nocardiopsis sp. L17-MgMaSL7]PWV47261.1 2-haloacid dehalogenase [Nocardiopsis sp. L17-MgMaSL7]
MTSLPDLDTIVFDVLGTMVDEPDGIRRGIRTALPNTDGEEVERLLKVWSEHVEGRQREIVAGGVPYVNGAGLDLEAAAHVAAAAGIDDDEAVLDLANAALRPDPWPDSVRALERIASRYSVVGLSNASGAALTRISAHAGLRWHRALTAEDARSYKPHPDVYRLAVANAGCAPERLLMVAAHAWDLRGARELGLRTAYVERPGGDPPVETDSFDLTARSLDELAIQLNAV